MAEEYNGTTLKLSPEEYESLFYGKKEKALEHALDIRKFEIELYWKRATYFWTFIAATLTGYFTIQAIVETSFQHKNLFLLLLSSLGMVFSVAWFFVNKGSKYWQENWEKHVDVLEDSITGPLYKVVLSRNEDMNVQQKFLDFFTGPAPLSVSKINQLISAYVAILWFGLWCLSLISIYEEWGTLNDKWILIFIIAFSVVAILSFMGIGQRYSGGYWHLATLRKSRLKPQNIDNTNNSKCPLNLKFWLLAILWGASAIIASHFDIKIDPEWTLMIPAGIFIGGSAFAVFLMLDNFKFVLKDISLFILFILATISVASFAILGINSEFNKLWNVWFLLVPYLFSRFYFGAKICPIKNLK